MSRYALVLILLLGGVPCTQASVVGQEVTYQDGETTMKGYLAWDDAIAGKRPGVLVVHEWWGLNDYARRRAEMLAALGYTALAVDMYGDGRTAGHPEDAGKFSGAVRKDLPLMKARFEAARAFLNRQPSVDPSHNAAIGYCFGGSVVLEMARMGEDLDGVVSFHGSLGGLGPISDKVTAKFLVANGAADPFVTKEQIELFEQDMDAAGVDYNFISYPGAKHSFTNPDADAFGQQFGLPLAYNADADAASWSAMQDFLKNIFK
ncbi:MAG: dienelactone hydrolase family protein [Pseudomonadota bacterium]